MSYTFDTLGDGPAPRLSADALCDRGFGAQTNRVRAARHRIAVAAACVLVAGCTGEQIVNTSDQPPPSPATTTTPPPAPSDTHLVNAFDYAGHPAGGTRYYFTTPSERWACAIVPRLQAGCSSASDWETSMGITGEPDSVPDAAGAPATPNALVVEREAEARFVALDQPEFVPDPGPAKVLQFNRTLAAAGFRCNVQETGVSCLSELSGKGFTFSDDGVVPRYTDVPVGAP
jgi:hypothetical protein